MNVIIKEEIDDLVNIKEEIIEDEDFLSLQQNNQDSWSDTENCQIGEKLLPFEFIKLEPIEEEYQYVQKEYEEVFDLNEQKFYSYVEQNSEDKSSDLENASPGEILLPFEYNQVEPREQSDQNFLMGNRLETETCTRNQVIIGTKDEMFKKNCRFYSLLRPVSRLASSTNSRSYQPTDESTVVLQKLKEKGSEFKISLWETAQILMRREQDRKRKALRRARETEEEKNLRRQKERLARAARRARESLEKKLMRREKDRKAKALSRALGIQGKQRRLDRNRLVENETCIG